MASNGGYKIRTYFRFLSLKWLKYNIISDRSLTKCDFVAIFVAFTAPDKPKGFDRASARARIMPMDSSAATVPSSDYVPTAAELDQTKRFWERTKERPPAPRMKITQKGRAPAVLSSDHPDDSLWAVALRAAFGTVDHNFTSWLFDQLINAAHEGGGSKPLRESEVNAVLTAMHGIAPRDETEAMLAVQMVATHCAAMQGLRRLRGVETIQQLNSNGTVVNKLLRTFAAQVEALSRYRGKGAQTVRVEHVHVQAGAQAIVGAVSTG
jgi:hypothetical protein